MLTDYMGATTLPPPMSKYYSPEIRSLHRGLVVLPEIRCHTAPIPPMQVQISDLNLDLRDHPDSPCDREW